MKKPELINAIAAKCGESNKIVENVVTSFIDVIKESMMNDEAIDIYGFAKFESVVQPERTVRNPKTGETKISPAKKVPKCRFKPLVKNELNS